MSTSTNTSFPRVYDNNYILNNKNIEHVRHSLSQNQLSTYLVGNKYRAIIILNSKNNFIHLRKS